MDISTTITLDDEQAAALASAVASRNAANGTDVSAEQHLREILDAEILRLTAVAYGESVRRHGEAARHLPYAKRLEVTAALEAQLS
jgi:hypothetical protein